MTRISLLNGFVSFLFFFIIHLAYASKPSIKTVTVNPCALTSTPPVAPPFEPCPTVTISTSHTSCPPTTPTSCSQEFCISDAFISVPCTCPYSVLTTTIYTPCPSSCSQTCYTGHQIYHETSCSTTIDTYTAPSTTTITPIGTLTTPIIDSTPLTASAKTLSSCPYYPPYPTYCDPPCPVNTPTTTITTDPNAPTTTKPITPTEPSTAALDLVTCSCPYFPPYPTNCVYPCPVHTPTTVITVPTTITPAPSCESITITRGESCPPVVGGPCTSPDCIYLSTVTINCGCGGSIGTVTSCKTTCDGACGTTWQTVALPCPTIPPPGVGPGYGRM